MAFAVIFSPEFGSWFDEQENSLQRAVLVYVGLLEERSPQLSRPYADTLKGTRLNNLKELRVQYRGNPYRILYAFDPERQALLLVGGNKAGDRRWYDRMIPVAETLFERHLEDLEKEKDDDDRTTH